MKESKTTDDGVHIAYVAPASEAAVKRVLRAPVDDGRSKWVWVRLASGELLLGVFPQWDIYEACKGEAP